MCFCRGALAAGGRFQALEPGWLPTQSRLSRWVMSLDRGVGIRTLSEWLLVVQSAFTICTVPRKTGLIRLPYTHVFVEGRPDESSS